jgi:hypothetical protein
VAKRGGSAYHVDILARTRAERRPTPGRHLSHGRQPEEFGCR